MVKKRKLQLNSNKTTITLLVIVGILLILVGSYTGQAWRSRFSWRSRDIPTITPTPTTTPTTTNGLTIEQKKDILDIFDTCKIVNSDSSHYSGDEACVELIDKGWECVFGVIDIPYGSTNTVTELAPCSMANYGDKYLCCKP